MLFIFSGILALWVAFALARRLASGWSEALWIVLGALASQIASIAVVTSLAHALTPLGWILTQAGLAFGSAALFRIAWPLPRAGSPVVLDAECVKNVTAWLRGLPALALAGLACIVVFVLCSVVIQAWTPILGGDERMYHASRVIYWVQHHSLLPYETHNDRQTVFTFGSELFFLWPVLLTSSEAIGRIVFWLAYPLAAIGVYIVLRALRMTVTGAIVGALVVTATPIVVDSAVGLKPELWSMVFLLGTAYWVAQICLRPDDCITSCGCLPWFAVLAIGMRSLNIVLLPVVMLVPFLVRSRVGYGTRLASLALGLALGLITSGVLVPFGFNERQYGHPMGPAGLRAVVQSDHSPRQLYTHAVRFVLLLAELPSVPSAAVRAALKEGGDEFAASLDANEPLALENDNDWPGRFSYEVPAGARRFSAAGLLLLPVLVVAALRYAQNVISTFPRVRLAPLSAISMLAVPLFASIVLGVRWMAGSGVPDRFLVGPFALGVCIEAVLLGGIIRRSRAAAVLAIAVVAWTVSRPLAADLFHAEIAVTRPVPDANVEEPFGEPLKLIGCGARILFVGGQAAPDYPLFRPRVGFCNSVVSWGKMPFDARRMEARLRDERPTHIILQNDQIVDFHWDPPIAIRPMVEWLSHEPGITEVPLRLSPSMRLFVVGRPFAEPVPSAAEGPLQLPAQFPLVIIDPLLRGRVGLGMDLMSPWPVEHTEASKQGFLWIGSQPRQGLGLVLTVAERVNVRLTFDVSPGLSRTGGDTASFQVGSAPVVRREVASRTPLTFDVRLDLGRNPVWFWSDDEPTLPVQPNGDRRPLMLGLHEVRVEQSSGR